MFDSHIHSTFSPDSGISPQSACARAILLSLEGIAITDHIDYDYPGHEDEYIVDFEKYFRALDDLRNSFSSKLNIIKGIEIGLQPHVLEQTFNEIKNYDFDFIIGSVHIINRLDPYADKEVYNGTKEQVYARYLEEILDLISKYEYFDVLGHIDYIIRNACYDDNTLYYQDHACLIDEIFKLIINRGQGIEINTRSYIPKRNRGRFSLDPRLLTRYRELGGEIITIGSDSHSVDYIGYEFNCYIEIIRNAGFRYIAYYKERKPVFLPIR